MNLDNFTSFINVLLYLFMGILKGVVVVGCFLKEEGIEIIDGPKFGSCVGIGTKVEGSGRWKGGGWVILSLL